MGVLNYMRVWHDDSGSSGSWFLKYIIVRDLQTMQREDFMCQQWLAVDKADGAVILSPSESNTVSCELVFFSDRTISARRERCGEKRVWVSVREASLSQHVRWPFMVLYLFPNRHQSFHASPAMHVLLRVVLHGNAAEHHVL